ncbi:MAG: hypothetical protein NTX38_02325 [Methylobacter sp.]|nr:hypothetical protein [Methylobacter sp.]
MITANAGSDKKKPVSLFTNLLASGYPVSINHILKKHNSFGHLTKTTFLDMHI